MAISVAKTTGLDASSTAALMSQNQVASSTVLTDHLESSPVVLAYTPDSLDLNFISLASNDAPNELTVTWPDTLVENTSDLALDGTSFVAYYPPVVAQITVEELQAQFKNLTEIHKTSVQNTETLITDVTAARTSASRIINQANTLKTQLDKLFSNKTDPTYLLINTIIQSAKSNATDLKNQDLSNPLAETGQLSSLLGLATSTKTGYTNAETAVNKALTQYQRISKPNQTHMNTLQQAFTTYEQFNIQNQQDIARYRAELNEYTAELNGSDRALQVAQAMITQLKNPPKPPKPPVMPKPPVTQQPPVMPKRDNTDPKAIFDWLYPNLQNPSNK